MLQHAFLENGRFLLRDLVEQAPARRARPARGERRPRERFAAAGQRSPGTSARRFARAAWAAAGASSSLARPPAGRADDAAAAVGPGDAAARAGGLGRRAAAPRQGRGRPPPADARPSSPPGWRCSAARPGGEAGPTAAGPAGRLVAEPRAQQAGRARRARPYRPVVRCCRSSGNKALPGVAGAVAEARRDWHEQVRGRALGRDRGGAGSGGAGRWAARPWPWTR